MAYSLLSASQKPSEVALSDQSTGMSRRSLIFAARWAPAGAAQGAKCGLPKASHIRKTSVAHELGLGKVCPDIASIEFLTSQCQHPCELGKRLRQLM